MVAVFEGAVADRVIAINPATARKIELPKAPPREAAQLVNLDVDDVARLAGVVSPWMSAFVCRGDDHLRATHSDSEWIEEAGLSLSPGPSIRRFQMSVQALSMVAIGAG